MRGTGRHRIHDAPSERQLHDLGPNLRKGCLLHHRSRDGCWLVQPDDIPSFHAAEGLRDRLLELVSNQRPGRVGHRPAGLVSERPLGVGDVGNRGIRDLGVRQVLEPQ